MATDYPTAIDDYTRPLATDYLNNPSHSGVHDNAFDAIEAIETVLGTSPQGGYTDVVARLVADEAAITLNTTLRTALNALNGIMKCDGAGSYSAITDSSANWDTAYTHSQIAGGDSVHVSTTENTQWDAAYTHSQIAGGNSVHVSTTENTQWDAAYTHSQLTHDYAYITGNDGATDVTAAELETLTDGSSTALHTHAGLGTDEKVKIDAAAAAGYIGAASNDGVLRTGSNLSYTDGGSYVTLNVNSTKGTQWDAAYTHSQIAGGNSVHVSTTENTQWDAAYTHSQIAGGNSVHVSTTENTNWDAAYTHVSNNGSDHSYVDMTGTLDEDNMASNSAVKWATQQSIKAYVDAAVTGATVSFGAWSSKSDNTVYQAATDGFVIALELSNAVITGYTDGSNPPTTVRGKGSANANGGTFCMPVRSGDYWKTAGVTDAVYWLPIS